MLLRVTGRRSARAAHSKTAISAESRKEKWGERDTDNERSSDRSAARLDALYVLGHNCRAIDSTCNSRRTRRLVDGRFRSRHPFYFQRYGCTAISYFPNEPNGRRRTFIGEPLGRRLKQFIAGSWPRRFRVDEESHRNAREKERSERVKIAARRPDDGLSAAPLLNGWHGYFSLF